MASSNSILILGASGKLGSALASVLKKKYEVIGVDSTHFDASDPKQVDAYFRLIACPSIVINCVAFMGIDACEKNPQRAFMLNTCLPHMLVSIAESKGVKLIHFSTDSVFSDRRSGSYCEEDCPSPINAYGLTKYGGDCHVLTSAADAVVIRVGTLFGGRANRQQFFDRMLAKAASGQPISVADDVVTSATYTFDVAQRLAQMLEEDAPAGLYHLANEGAASLYEIVNAMVEKSGLDIEVRPVSHREFYSLGKKNTFTPISSCRVPALRPWQEALPDFLRALN